MSIAVFELLAPADVDEKGIVKIKRKFLCIGPLGMNAAGAIAALPIAKYDPHPNYARAFARTPNATPLDEHTPGFMFVEYSYDSHTTDEHQTQPSNSNKGKQDQDQHPTPTAREKQVKFSDGQRHVPFTEDFSTPRKAVMNSSKQPLQGVDTEEATQPFTVSFWMPATQDVVIKQNKYNNSLNLAEFKIFPDFSAYPAKTVRCLGYKGDYKEEAQGIYLKVDVEFEFKRNGWDKKILDQGTVELIPGQPAIISPGGNTPEVPDRWETIKDKDGNPIQEPVNLNGFGRRNPPGAAPVYLTFIEYQPVSWTDIFNVE